MRFAGGAGTLLLWVSLATLWGSGSALAAVLGTIDIDGTEVFEGPGKGYKVVEKLAKGAQVAASNIPTEGYFKVRTTLGTVGWVSADSLVIENGKEGGGRSHSGGKRKYVRIRGLGGADFFDSKTFNDTFFAGTSVLSTGFYAGGELHLLITRSVAFAVRAERLFKSIAVSVTSSDGKSTSQYQVDLASIPVMGGFELQLTPSMTGFSLNMAFEAGLALKTELSATNIDKSSDNTTRWSDQPFTGLGKINFCFNAVPSFGIFIEGGYRYLKTRDLSPTTAGTQGQENFQDSNKNFKTFPVDLSGPFVGAGLQIHL